jgi:hypothetical protein
MTLSIAAHEHALGCAGDAASWPEMRALDVLGNAHCCDLCRGVGTHWRCVTGCDYDCCAACGVAQAACGCVHVTCRVTVPAVGLRRAS